MKRKDFLSKSMIAIGGLATFVGLSSSSKNEHQKRESEDCELSPRETRGPFPNKTPLEYVRENIIGDRAGIPLMIKLSILNKNEDCKPIANVDVDIWHCDSKGRYSEYGGNGLQPEDMTKTHFLRGRQRTNASGEVSFISIFPGYYPGRAPHIHIEVLKDKKSLLATQIAFEDEVCKTVYTDQNYGATRFTSLHSDSLFRNSKDLNLADSVSGNLEQGYILLKNIIVEA